MTGAATDDPGRLDRDAATADAVTSADGATVTGGATVTAEGAGPLASGSPSGRRPARIGKDLDPEDWAASPGSSDEWLRRERPPHW